MYCVLGQAVNAGQVKNRTAGLVLRSSLDQTIKEVHIATSYSESIRCQGTPSNTQGCRLHITQLYTYDRHQRDREETMRFVNQPGV